MSVHKNIFKSSLNTYMIYVSKIKIKIYFACKYVFFFFYCMRKKGKTHRRKTHRRNTHRRKHRVSSSGKGVNIFQLPQKFTNENTFIIRNPKQENIDIIPGLRNM